MWQKLSEKNKFYFSIGIFLIALLICHKIAFQNTFRIISSYHDQLKKSIVANEMPRKAAFLKSQLKELDAKYFDSMKDIDKAHETILENISSLAATYNVTVTEYPEKHDFEKGSFETETHVVVIQGKFINLLNVLYQMEITPHIGRIASVEYFTETDRATKAQNLYTRIYIQNYRNRSSHETK